MDIVGTWQGRGVNVVRKNDLVNLKWFHFDHFLTTSFDFSGRSEVFIVFLWCDATLSKLKSRGFRATTLCTYEF